MEPDIKTKLSEGTLKQYAVNLGIDPEDRNNLVMIAFLNDVEFRKKVTEFFFQQAIEAAKERV